MSKAPKKKRGGRLRVPTRDIAEGAYTDSLDGAGARELLARPAAIVRTRPRRPWTYRVFISHRYARSDEYRRLVRMLDRAAERDPRWRWENLSIPRETPVMTDKQAQQGELYERRIRERMRRVDVVLLIDRAEWLENVNSLYLELTEGTWHRNRPSVPIISVLPRGVAARSLAYRGPGVVTVKWHPRSVIRAIRRHALPASASCKELRLKRGRSAESVRIVWLTPEESSERRRIAKAIRANAGDLPRAAAALGTSTSTLRRKAAAYLLR